MKRGGIVVERPQWLWLRTAVGIHGSDIVAALETYDRLSQGFFIHATPTLKNAGLKDAQLASCFMQVVDATSTATTFRGLEQLATIFMQDGGIGVDLHNIPAKRYVPASLPHVENFSS